MFKIDDVLLTAPTSGTILKGITRDSVLKITRDWGIQVEERPVEVAEIVKAAREGCIQEAFGVGTAATIAPIAKIGFEDEVFELPNPENGELAQNILRELNNIRYGLIEDRYGWTYRID